MKPQFKLKLPAADATYTGKELKTTIVPDTNPANPTGQKLNEDFVDVEVNTRQQYLNVLKIMMNAKGTKAKFDEAMGCMNFVAACNNVTDTDDFIIVDDSDLKFLKQGWELIPAEKRPLGVIANFPEIFENIASPEKYETPPALPEK